MASGAFRKFSNVIATIIKSEKLEELPAVPVGRARRSFFSWLFQAESLPFDERMNGRKGSSFSSALFAAEALPVDDLPVQRNAQEATRGKDHGHRA